MSLDKDLVKEAKEQFHKDYKDKIEDLGYQLSQQVTTVKGTPAIYAMIKDTEGIGFPEGIKEQVGNILPKTYSFKGEEIPVKTDYFGLVRAL